VLCKLCAGVAADEEFVVAALPVVLVLGRPLQMHVQPVRLLLAILAHGAASPIDHHFDGLGYAVPIFLGKILRR
jgi:hypothetical protein